MIICHAILYCHIYLLLLLNADVLLLLLLFQKSVSELEKDIAESQAALQDQLTSSDIVYDAIHINMAIWV